MLLRDATLAGGRRVDVRVGTATVEAVGSLAALDGEEVVDLGGLLLLPAPAEPHSHLDKALTADLAPNHTGDLLGAIQAWMLLQPTLTVEDIAARAEVAARALLASGCTAVRTHVNVGGGLGLKAVDALLQAREALDGLLDLELVALAGELTGDVKQANRSAVVASMAAGIDVVGGCPHLEADPLECIDWCLDLAGELGRPLDLHMDETLNPAMLTLPYLCERVLATGFAHGVTASHCVSLGVQDEPTQRKVAEQCAESGVAVVVLPQTNLFLQGRDHRASTPRGLTAVRALLEAGATLAAGADNIQDPFNTMGRADPMETGALLVMAAHLLPAEAYAALANGARTAMGRPSSAGLDLAPGDPAELVALPSPSVRAALADGPGGRVVVHRGRIVADGRGRQDHVTEPSSSSHGMAPNGRIGFSGS